ncbi:choline dehydrogenase [Actinoplanes sp. TBRC 11911]|uniref:GMC family oxidoreductase n=1 Tax=Actinoplanes sp. TBRC 11911 TaxID=2729386 RepID=UPI00145DE349|nr:GMC oxidoreductase [Actinoplanes sp. TBRC 11911]NMO49743.1 choline dehydrogenase [Actinoplanes sp. TBRC 11911]
METHDVIVVGGDDAADVLAARLAEGARRKVLLIENGARKRSVNHFARGHRSAYHQWGEDWSFYDLLPYFKRSENAYGRDLILRGRGGPLTVAPPAETSPFMAAVLDAAAEAGEHRAADLGAGWDEGFGTVDSVDGAYPVPAANVVAGALVHRLRFAKGRAVGVDYSVGSRLFSVSAGQVVVAAGAAESAQLLMLSGIGPAGHLGDLGIDVVADLPGVGANVQAHPVARLVYRTRQRPSGRAIGLVRSRPELSGPDLRLIFGDDIAVSVVRPHSRGRLRLADAVPGTPPLIEANFYRDERDAAAVVAGLRLGRRIAATAALSGWLAGEEVPGPANGEERELSDYARRTVTSYGQWAGTLALGSVVDGGLRLRGVGGVHVADASVMPSIPSADLTATGYAIAERAADLILGDAGR